MEGQSTYNVDELKAIQDSATCLFSGDWLQKRQVSFDLPTSALTALTSEGLSKATGLAFRFATEAEVATSATSDDLGFDKRANLNLDGHSNKQSACV